MLQSILNNLSDFLVLNTGTFFKNIYPHATHERDSEGDLFPAYWESGEIPASPREVIPLLQDHLTNYAYFRVNGEIDLNADTSLIGRGFTYEVTVPMRMVIHYDIPNNGEINYDIATTFIQFLSGWNFTPGTNSQIQYANAAITSTNVDTIDVHSNETDKEPNLRHEDRLVSIDFDLNFKFSSLTSCIESDICLGDLGAIDQVSVGPLNVTSFANAGCSKTVTYAEGVTAKSSLNVTPGCIYFISDKGIYLEGITTSEFSLEGWLISAGDIDDIKYDWDNDNIFERRDKFNNLYRVTKVYIDLFGNPISSFPWNNSVFQGNTIVDSTFLHVGFTGALCLGNTLGGLSTLDITGSSGIIQLNTLSNQTIATLSGAGTMALMAANTSTVTISNGSIDTGTFDQATFTNDRPGALTNITVLSGSTFIINGGTTSYSVVLVENNSLVTSGSEGNWSNVQMINASCNISSNTGLLTGITVIDSVFDLSGNDTGTPSLTNMHISANASLQITDNSTNLSKWTIIARNVALTDASELYIFEPITFVNEIFSNVTVQKAVDGTGTIDLNTNNNAFVGIVEVITSAAALVFINFHANWPERGRLRIVTDTVPSPITINKTAPAGAGVGQFVMDANHTLSYHSATVRDFMEIEVVNGVCQLLNIQNFV